jgi:hypothetical protein
VGYPPFQVGAPGCDEIFEPLELLLGAKRGG